VTAREPDPNQRRALWRVEDARKERDAAADRFVLELVSARDAGCTWAQITVPSGLGRERLRQIVRDHHAAT
jgi:hypothetical protein